MGRYTWIVPFFISVAFHGAALSGISFYQYGPGAYRSEQEVLFVSIIAPHAGRAASAQTATSSDTHPSVCSPAQKTADKPSAAWPPPVKPHPLLAALKKRENLETSALPREEEMVIPTQAISMVAEPTTPFLSYSVNNGGNSEKFIENGANAGSRESDGPGGIKVSINAPFTDAPESLTTSRPATTLVPLKPAYPNISRRRGEEGKVTIQVEIGADGRPGKITIVRSSGHSRLDQAALQACKRAVFVPAIKGGKTVASTRSVLIRFKLE
ncbi:MAG: energy transducer TonB [Deltaproteobacteria bacterium]|nr:energy transducer TonB [Deltaproteobacteria bacterium]